MKNIRSNFCYGINVKEKGSYLVVTFLITHPKFIMKVLSCKTQEKQQ
jgi:hypothetical protein